LIRYQPLRFGKGDDDDGHSPLIEFTFDRFHLAEMMLARQSGEVPEKNEQRIFLKIILKVYRTAAQV
jgi:hypothetical protein